jgi:excisionase family DNA binding protein
VLTQANPAGRSARSLTIASGLALEFSTADGAALTFGPDALEQLRSALMAETQHASAPPSPFMTIKEAAVYLRAKPQRIHDLLSQRRLTRFKEGGRTLVRREELAAHVKEATGP